MATKESFVAALEDETQSSEKLIGSSGAWCKVLKQIELVASSNATVLITGESGTGKELVARPFMQRVCAKSDRLSQSTARQLRQSFSSRSFSDTREGRLQERTKTVLADSDLPRVGPFFSMKSAKSRFPSKANCCASYKKVNMSASAKTGRDQRRARDCCDES